jgi:hypothetical protein
MQKQSEMMNFRRNRRTLKPSRIFPQWQNSGVGGADFWILWIFNRRQLAADVKCYSKTKVEKAFFFISCLP